MSIEKAIEFIKKIQESSVVFTKMLVGEKTTAKELCDVAANILENSTKALAELQQQPEPTKLAKKLSAVLEFVPLTQQASKDLRDKLVELMKEAIDDNIRLATELQKKEPDEIKCIGCGTPIYHHSYCDRCLNQLES